MRVLPFIQCSTVPAEHITQYECSDRLLVAKNIQASHDLYRTICLLRISNDLDTYVVGTVYGFHDEDDIIYMPMWMMHILKTTHHVTIATVAHHACTKLSIKPYNSGLFEIEDWALKLRNGLRLYSTLTKGNMIAIHIDGIVYFTVEMLYPQSYNTIYLVGSGEMEVDIRPSFELEHTAMRNPCSIILVNECMPTAVENPPTATNKTNASNTYKASDDYSQIPYLVSIPHKLRKHALYDRLNVFGGAAHSIRTDTDSVITRGPGDAARRRMGIEP